MTPLRIAFLVLPLLVVTNLFAQKGTLRGKVMLSDGFPADFVNITVMDTAISTTTDERGRFIIRLPANKDLTLVIDAMSIERKLIQVNLKPGEDKRMTINVKSAVGTLDTFSVTGNRYNENRFEAGMIKFDPSRAEFLPTPTGEFTQILRTLGAGGNNELTSGYNVRGGNYDENLIYVNDILIYRPFLVRQGQQEGLGFVNVDLVSDVSFSTGGWQPRYGDKLSSVLAVEYEAPKEWKGKISLGLLNSSASLGGVSKDNRFRFVFGARHRSLRYLFENSALFSGLDVQGEYFPSFQDLQFWGEYDVKTDSLGNPITTLGLLMSYARNRYSVIPASRETTFGTVNQALRLFVAFEGEEALRYDTRQAGIKLDHRWSGRFRSSFSLSGVDTREREVINTEGAYRLCDVNTDFGDEDFNECVFNRGIGTFFQYGRNDLDGFISNFLNRNYFLLNKNNLLEFGVEGAYEQFDDRLYEYEYIDSADFIDITRLTISNNFLQSFRFNHYIQNTTELDSGRHVFTYGYRGSYWSLNNQFLFSPRLQYGYQPPWERDWIFRFATGLYQQHAFYRELRRLDGTLNEDLRAQRSYHMLAGTDYNLKIWERPFKISLEGYFKYIEDAVAYTVDNLRIRYYANNRTDAYATGFDFRMGGEFIRNTESWFYVGLLITRENLEFDSVGWVPRPTDQRLTVGSYFEDHLPGNPTVRVHLNLVFSTGLPFGPPDNIDLRTAARLNSYRRVDIGFAKILGTADKSSTLGKYYESAWIGLEVLNLLGTQNNVSYLWINDFSNNQFAVPNNLSARFINLKATVHF